MSYFKIIWVDEGVQNKDNSRYLNMLESLGVCYLEGLSSIDLLVRVL